MDFLSLYNSLKSRINSFDDVSKFISELNVLPLSVRISLAKSVLDFMETNPLINETLLKSLNISWSAEELASTRQKIAVVEKAANTATLGGDPEVYKYKGHYITNDAPSDLTASGNTPGEGSSNSEFEANSTVPSGEILWNIWLTRTLKAATLIIACVAIAIIGYVVYQKWDVIKDKLGDFGDMMSGWLGKITNSSTRRVGLQYPFEADATLLKEASINFTLLRFLAEVLGTSEERALNVVRAIKEIDTDLVKNFLEMEQRVSDVRAVGKRPIASAVSYVGKG